MSQANLPSNIKSFNEIQEDNLLVVFINFVKTNMNCNYLSKKLITWFNENREAKKEKPFGFRFRGKESFNYLQNFPQLFQMLKFKIASQAFHRLMQVFYQSINLRKLVSFSVRIENISEEDIQCMQEVG